jgi:hypothetical protein
LIKCTMYVKNSKKGTTSWVSVVPAIGEDIVIKGDPESGIYRVTLVTHILEEGWKEGHAAPPHCVELVVRPVYVGEYRRHPFEVDDSNLPDFTDEV